MEYKLPLEQQAKDETEHLKIGWESGPYSFLLQRTQEKYHLKANQKRRQQIESQLNVKLPMINDEILLALYKYSCQKYMRKCNQRYDCNSGFGKTSSERSFAATLEAIIKDNPKLKHLEIYPGEKQNKDLFPTFKMVVGNWVPDFFVFGLKIKGCSAVAIEIDGDAHIEKSAKDELRNAHFKKLKIFTFEIQNGQATDINFLSKAILKMYRLRNGSFNDQIKRVKRSIWTKTISCQLSFEEIEQITQGEFDLTLNLKVEVAALLKLETCPRIIKRELSKNHS